MKCRLGFTIIFLFWINSISNYQETKRDSAETTNDSIAFYYSNASLGYYYSDIYKVSVSPGYSEKDNMQISAFSEHYFLNLNYSISSFYEPLYYSPSQVGFYNEIGLDNISLYLNIGPELRLKKHIFIIPYIGISVILFSKYPDDDLAVIYYIGAAAGYFFNINSDTDLIFEASSDFIKLKKDQKKYLF